jgi:hypothetical protein
MLMIYAPYVDTTLFPAFEIEHVTDVKVFTLGFVTANSYKEPSWGGYYDVRTLYYQNSIDAVRKNGGDVIVSFGGAAGQELATVCRTVSELVRKYASVINLYDFTSIDFDIEGKALGSKKSNQLRAKAILELQVLFPNIKVSLTVPASERGLDKRVLELVEQTPCDLLNLMLMDYGNGAGKMAQWAISGAKAARSQTGKNIGITVMIGKNDVGGEVFTLSDAHIVKEFVDDTEWVKRLSIWSINRDNGSKLSLVKSSMVDQDPYQYSDIFRE